MNLLDYRKAVEESIAEIAGLRTPILLGQLAVLLNGVRAEEQRGCLAAFQDMLTLHLTNSEGPEADAAADRLDHHCRDGRQEFSSAVSGGLYAVADQEREACAKVAEEFGGGCAGAMIEESDAGEIIAVAIRARGKETSVATDQPTLLPSGSPRLNPPD